jgi:hypothetical protein
MPLEDKIIKYSVSLFQNDIVNYTRQIRLNLESGGSASIQFPKELPADWLQFFGNATSLYLTEDQFTDVYHVIQSEAPVFLTALNLFGIRVGAVHTELDLTAGEIPGEGDEDPQGLVGIIRRARKEQSGG